MTKALRVLQDAINDVRAARTKKEVQIASTRCKAIAFATSIWLGGWDKFILFEKFIRQQQQIEVVMARMQIQVEAEQTVQH